MREYETISIRYKEFCEIRLAGVSFEAIYIAMENDFLYPMIDD